MSHKSIFFFFLETVSLITLLDALQLCDDEQLTPRTHSSRTVCVFEFCAIGRMCVCVCVCVCVSCAICGMCVCVRVNHVPLAGYMCVSVCVSLTPSWTAAHRDNKRPL